MAKQTTKKHSTPMDKMITAVGVVVVLAVLGLAVFATYGRISDNLGQNAIEKENLAIQNGEQEATVRYLASNSGMDVTTYLEQYGLQLGDGLKETTTESEMVKMLTVENYYKYTDVYSGETTDVDALLTDWDAQALGITKDTVWSEVEEKLSYGKLIGEEEYNSMIEQYSMYGYDLSAVNADMTIKEFSEKMTEVMSAGPTGTMAPELTEQAAATAEETADTAEAEETAE